MHASNAFYDRLIQIEGFETMSITKVAQRIQRSAYPDAYARHEPQARVIASALSGYSVASFGCRLRAVATATGTRPGSDGLTGRAHALAQAATEETGQPPAGAVGAAGTTARFTVTGAQGQRRGWSLAQWAVARAGGLGVVSVQTDHRQWTRDGGDGWKPAGQGPAAGTVLITVAAG